MFIGPFVRTVKIEVSGITVAAKCVLCRLGNDRYLRLPPRSSQRGLGAPPVLRCDQADSGIDDLAPLAERLVLANRCLGGSNMIMTCAPQFMLEGMIRRRIEATAQAA
jgi:hypothetical protein